jgi:hypothetical protein
LSGEKRAIIADRPLERHPAGRERRVMPCG